MAAYNLPTDPSGLYYGGSSSNLINVAGDNATFNDQVQATTIVCDNLSVTGTTTVTHLQEVNLQAPVLELAVGNTVGDATLTGVLVNYKAGGSTKLAGLVRQPGTGTWYLEKNASNQSMSDSTAADLNMGTLYSTAITNSNLISTGALTVVNAINAVGVAGAVNATNGQFDTLHANHFTTPDVGTNSIEYTTTVTGPHAVLDDGAGNLHNTSVQTGEIDCDAINIHTGSIEVAAGDLNMAAGGIELAVGGIDLAIGTIDLALGDLLLGVGNIAVIAGSINVPVGLVSASAGTFYTLTGTSSALGNISGLAAELSGGLTVGGLTTLNGSVNINGTVTVEAAAVSITTAGITAITADVLRTAGTYQHNGIATFTGDTNVIGLFTAEGEIISLTAPEIKTNGTLMHTGIATFTGDTNVVGLFSAEGEFAGITAANIRTTGILTHTGLCNIGGNVAIEGTFEAGDAIVGALECGNIQAGNFNGGDINCFDIQAAKINAGDTTTAALQAATIETAGSLVVLGASSFTGQVTTLGNASIAGALECGDLAAGDIECLAVQAVSVETAGALTVQGIANITGLVTTQGGVTVGGALIVNGLFTAQGAANVAGLLTAQGAMNVVGLLTAQGAMNVTGLFTAQGAANVAGLLTAQGAMNVAGLFTAQGAANVAGLLTAQGAMNVTGLLTAQGALVVNGVSTLTGAVTCSGQLTVVGNTTMAAVECGNIACGNITAGTIECAQLIAAGNTIEDIIAAGANDVVSNAFTSIGAGIGIGVGFITSIVHGIFGGGSGTAVPHTVMWMNGAGDKVIGSTNFGYDGDNISISSPLTVYGNTLVDLQGPIQFKSANNSNMWLQTRRDFLGTTTGNGWPSYIAGGPAGGIYYDGGSSFGGTSTWHGNSDGTNVGWGMMELGENGINFYSDFVASTSNNTYTNSQLTAKKVFSITPSSISLSGGMVMHLTLVTTLPYTILNTDVFLSIATGASSGVISLPTTQVVGQTFYLITPNSFTGTVTITHPGSGWRFNGVNTTSDITLAPDMTLQFICAAANVWYVFGTVVGNLTYPLTVQSLFTNSSITEGGTDFIMNKNAAGAVVNSSRAAGRALVADVGSLTLGFANDFGTIKFGSPVQSMQLNNSVTNFALSSAPTISVTSNQAVANVYTQTGTNATAPAAATVETVVTLPSSLPSNYVSGSATASTIVFTGTLATAAGAGGEVITLRWGGGVNTTTVASGATAISFTWNWSAGAVNVEFVPNSLVTAQSTSIVISTITAVMTINYNKYTPLVNVPGNLQAQSATATGLLSANGGLSLARTVYSSGSVTASSTDTYISVSAGVTLTFAVGPLISTGRVFYVIAGGQCTFSCANQITYQGQTAASFSIAPGTYTVMCISATNAWQVMGYGINLTAPSTGQVLSYNSSTNSFVNAALPATTPNSSYNLSGLGDVTLGSLINGQQLVYDSSLAKWKNSSTSTATLAGLTDVLLTSQSNTQYLGWDSASSKWKNMNVPSTTPNSSYRFDGLSDVAITSPANNQILQYNTSLLQWVNATNLALGSGTITTTGTVSSGAHTISTSSATPLVVTSSATGLMTNFMGNSSGATTNGNGAYWQFNNAGNNNAANFARFGLNGTNGITIDQSSNVTIPSNLYLGGNSSLYFDNVGNYHLPSGFTWQCYVNGNATLQVGQSAATVNGNLGVTGTLSAGSISMGSPDGSTTNPSIYWDGDTGIYSTGDGNLDFAANNQQCATITTGGLDLHGKQLTCGAISAGWDITVTGGRSIFVDGDIKTSGGKVLTQSKSFSGNGQTMVYGTNAWAPSSGSDVAFLPAATAGSVVYVYNTSGSIDATIQCTGSDHIYWGPGFQGGTSIPCNRTGGLVIWATGGFWYAH